MRLPPLVLGFLLGTGLLSGACQRPPEGLRELPAVEDFTLTDADDAPFRAADLDGSVWVVNFFFTRCPTICPRLMDGVAEIHSRWAAEPGVRFLSISVDGGFDTPEILRAYRQQRSLPEERWTLATGEREAVVALSEQSFLQALSSTMDAHGDILHSSRVLVLDQERHLRGWFDALDEADQPRLDAVLRYLVAAAD